jgi:hypothetical protein
VGGATAALPGHRNRVDLQTFTARRVVGLYGALRPKVREYALQGDEGPPGALWGRNADTSEELTGHG